MHSRCHPPAKDSQPTLGQISLQEKIFQPQHLGMGWRVPVWVCGLLSYILGDFLIDSPWEKSLGSILPGEIGGSASANSIISWVHNKNAGPFVQKSRVGEALVFLPWSFSNCHVFNLLLMSPTLRHGDICWVGESSSGTLDASCYLELRVGALLRHLYPGPRYR